MKRFILFPFLMVSILLSAEHSLLKKIKSIHFHGIYHPEDYPNSPSEKIKLSWMEQVLESYLPTTDLQEREWLEESSLALEQFPSSNKMYFSVHKKDGSQEILEMGMYHPYLLRRSNQPESIWINQQLVSHWMDRPFLKLILSLRGKLGVPTYLGHNNPLYPFPEPYDPSQTESLLAEYLDFRAAMPIGEVHVPNEWEENALESGYFLYLTPYQQWYLRLQYYPEILPEIEHDIQKFAKWMCQEEKIRFIDFEPNCILTGVVEPHQLVLKRQPWVLEDGGWYDLPATFRLFNEAMRECSIRVEEN